MRPRFQFRLRTLLIAVAACAVGCWVVVDRQRLTRERDEAVYQRDKMVELDRERELGIISHPRYQTEINRLKTALRE